MYKTSQGRAPRSVKSLVLRLHQLLLPTTSSTTHLIDISQIFFRVTVSHLLLHQWTPALAILFGLENEHKISMNWVTSRRIQSLCIKSINCTTIIFDRSDAISCQTVTQRREVAWVSKQLTIALPLKQMFGNIFVNQYNQFKSYMSPVSDKHYIQLFLVWEHFSVSWFTPLLLKKVGLLQHYWYYWKN